MDVLARFIAVSVVTVDIGVVASDYGQKTIPMVAQVSFSSFTVPTLTPPAHLAESR